jgi:hypothetical protein
LRWLPWAKYCYNMSLQTAMHATPFKVVYGRDPPAMLSYEQGQSRVPTVDKQLVARDKFLAEIKERLLHAQEVMKGNYDAHHCQVEFQVGDWVWLRLHHRIAATLTDKVKASWLQNIMGCSRCWNASVHWRIVWNCLHSPASTMSSTLCS